MTRWLTILLLSSSLSSCMHINSISLTQIPETRSKRIKTETSRFIILGLNFDNDYVDEMNEKLKNQCQDGKVQGILTKDETTNYFLFLVIKRSVTASGFCSKA